MIDIMTGTEQVSSAESTGVGKAVLTTVLLMLLLELAAGGAYWYKVRASAAPPVDPQALTSAVKAADTAWSAAAAKQNLEGVLAYYADGAAVMPPNQELMSTKADIRKLWEGMLVKGTDLSWTPGSVDLSASGDVAVVEGYYLMTTRPAKGKPAMDRGKYLETWRKQADGSWKVTADMWSSDLAAKK
jgi:ketosteroid isomerase-like protein